MAEIEEEREQLKEIVERDKEELQRALFNLKEVARQQLDISQRMSEKSVVWILGAFCLGAWIGLIVTD